MAGGLDVDGNEYPDVVVGAYDSDRNIGIFKFLKLLSFIIYFVVRKNYSDIPDLILLSFPLILTIDRYLCIHVSFEGNLYLNNPTFPILIYKDSKQDKLPLKYYCTHMFGYG